MRSKDNSAPEKKAREVSRRAWTTPTARRIATSSAGNAPGSGPDAETAVS